MDKLIFERKKIMKKYVALLEVICLLSIGFLFSLKIPARNETAIGLFSVFDVLFDEDDHPYFKYISTDPNQITDEAKDYFPYLMKIYCFRHGYQFLYLSRNELATQGYINESIFTNGVTFGFDYLSIIDDKVTGRAYLYYGNLSSYRREFTAIYENSDWSVTFSNNIIVS